MHYLCHGLYVRYSNAEFYLVHKRVEWFKKPDEFVTIWNDIVLTPCSQYGYLKIKDTKKFMNGP